MEPDQMPGKFNTILVQFAKHRLSLSIRTAAVKMRSHQVSVGLGSKQNTRVCGLASQRLVVTVFSISITVMNCIHAL